MATLAPAGVLGGSKGGLPPLACLFGYFFRTSGKSNAPASPRGEKVTKKARQGWQAPLGTPQHACGRESCHSKGAPVSYVARGAEKQSESVAVSAAPRRADIALGAAGIAEWVETRTATSG